MSFEIVLGDITQQKVDVIVNTTNVALQMSGAVCSAIFRAAGKEALQAACNQLAPINTGEAVITSGFDLPAKYIIHTVGPVYRGGAGHEADLLRAAYKSCLDLAIEYDCKSIAFPLISSGAYGYPEAKATLIAQEVILPYATHYGLDVILVKYAPDVLSSGAQVLFGKVEDFIIQHYQDPYRTKPIFPRHGDVVCNAPPPSSRKPIFNFGDGVVIDSSLKDLVPDFGSLAPSFSQTLLDWIRKSGKTDAEVYRRANIDRRLFSKIRNNEAYKPTKQTVTAFAIALELSLERTRELLDRAGFALSRSYKFDVIIEYFIRQGLYDVFQINEVLYSHGQPLLGSGVDA